MPHQATNPTRTARRTARAFTLIELLAVIAIIALLLALLLPALTGVRTSARRASTEALMREVLSAAQSFQAANSRPAGFFSAAEVGSRVNREQRGFTAMENLLLDLAGGVVPPDDPRYGDDPECPTAGNPGNTLVIVGPATSRDENVLVDTADIGGADGPGYLTLKEQDLFPVRGQAIGMLDEPDCYANGQIVKGMPDVVDAFGQPLLAWVQDPAAPVSPPATPTDDPYEYFVQEEYTPSENNRAPFYWASNAGYLESGGTNPQPSEPWTQGLGDPAVNQQRFSAIGGAANLTTKQRLASLAGVLGSPAFPVERQDAGDEWRPAQARGSLVLTSAGPDRVYFAPPNIRLDQQGVSAGDLGDLAVIGYAPKGLQGLYNGKTVRTVESSGVDDIIQSAGG